MVKKKSVKQPKTSPVRKTVKRTAAKQTRARNAAVKKTSIRKGAVTKPARTKVTKKRATTTKKETPKKAAPKTAASKTPTPRQAAAEKPTKTTLPPEPRAPRRKEPRESVARIDQQIGQLLQQRGEWIQRLAQGEQPALAKELTATSPEMLTKLAESVPGPIDPARLSIIYREILSACRASIRRERVAFLGPEYTYSHLAVVRHFGQSVQMVGVGSIAAVFEEVNRRHCDYGMVPIENSTDGRVVDTLDMFTKLPVRICGQIELRISHALLGMCQRNEIREIYSKPQALSQCRNWLAKHLPLARLIEVTSTTTAAQLARDKHGAAAIAGVQAASHYGLNVLAEGIEDNPTNRTRFAVIGTEAAAPSGHDRTAFLFEIKHEPGSLVQAMLIFKRAGLNMTWIESFPDPRKPRTYLFFVEIEGHENEPVVRRALETLGKRTARLEVLGSFPAIEEEIS